MRNPAALAFLVAGAALALALLALAVSPPTSSTIACRDRGAATAVGLAERNGPPRVQNTIETTTDMTSQAREPQWWAGTWPGETEYIRVADALRRGRAADVPWDPREPALLLLAADGIFGHAMAYQKEEGSGDPRELRIASPHTTPWAPYLAAACRARHATRALGSAAEAVRLTRPAAQTLPEPGECAGGPRGARCCCRWRRRPARARPAWKCAIKTR